MKRFVLYPLSYGPPDLGPRRELGRCLHELKELRHRSNTLSLPALDPEVKSLYSPIPVAAAVGGRTPNPQQIHPSILRFIVSNFGRINHHALPLTGSRVAVRGFVKAMNQGRPSALTLQASTCLGEEDGLQPPGKGSA